MKDTKRGTGRTTARMLRVIALAAATGPGCEVVFIDHARMTRKSAQEHAKTMRVMIAALGLSMTVEARMSGVYVMSTWQGGK
jgi:hypothetical protein